MSVGAKAAYGYAPYKDQLQKRLARIEGQVRGISKMIEDDAASVLGPWLVAHPWAGWLPGIASIYLELFALWVVTRPSLHRAWGLGLALFHLGTHLVMGIGFPQNTLWLALFLGLSPFRPREPGCSRPSAKEIAFCSRST